MSQCPRLRAVGEGYRFRHRDLGLDINMHQKRSRQPRKGSSLASTQARLGRLVVHLDHRALRDQADLVHREETRGHQEDLVEHREEARGHQEALVEEEVLVDILRPRDQAQAQVEDRVDRHPHRRRSLVDRTQIGEKCSTKNSSASE